MSKVFEFFKNKKLITIALIVTALLIAAGFVSVNTSKADQIETTKVVSLELAETVDASGTLEAQPFASLDWKTSGVVESVKVKPGQSVKKGDVLLTLQPESTSASIASAQSDLVSAQQNLEDILNSDSDLAQATIDLRDAQRNYDDKAGYLHYLQTNQRVPLTETRGWYEKGRMGGWTYVSKTRYYRGPATKDMLIEAEHNFELARAELEDVQLKVDRLTNKDQDILAAQAKVDAAQATVNSMRIVAPFDGEVLSVEHRAGDVISAGDLSVNIADLDHLYVKIQVDESDIANVKLGNRAEITLDAVTGVVLTGKVTAINPVGEAVSGLVKYSARIELDKVEGNIFLPLGTTANVVVKVKDAAAALAVPITVIQNDSNGEYVWVIQSDGSAKRVNIVSGTIVGELVVITGDLKSGDQVQLLAHENGFDAPNPFGGNQK